MLLGLAALLFLTTQLPSSGVKFGLGKIPSYQVTAQFGNIGQLKVGAPVRMAGVRIGDVTKIGFNTDSDRAEVVGSSRQRRAAGAGATADAGAGRVAGADVCAGAAVGSFAAAVSGGASGPDAGGGGESGGAGGGGRPRRARRGGRPKALARKIDHLEHRRGRARAPAGEHLVGDDAERIHVGGGAGLSFVLFRRRIARSEAALRGAGAFGPVGVGIEQPGDAEVQHLHALDAPLEEDDVARLEIAMHDPGAVREVEGFGDLDGPVERLLHVEPST